MNSNLTKRLLALLLCAAMLLPNLTALASAAQDSTGASQSAPETTQPEEEEKWVSVVPTDIPSYDTAGKVSQELVCDCGNGLS